MSNGNTVAVTNQTKLSDIPDYKPMYVPKSTYWHRVKDAEFGKSKAGNPMFTLTVEIVDHPGYIDPKTKETVDLNGVEATYWLTLTEKAAGNIKKFFKAAKLPTDITIDDMIKDPNPQFLIGKKFLAIGYSKLNPQIDEITGQPIKNPATGQDVVFYQYNLGDVFPQPGV